MIRHAKSFANIAGKYLSDESKKHEEGIPLAEWVKYFGDPKYIDSPLCPEGVQ